MPETSVAVQIKMMEFSEIMNVQLKQVSNHGLVFLSSGNDLNVLHPDLGSLRNVEPVRF